MKKIHESKMVFSAESLDNSGTRVACGFIPKSSPNPLGERVIESITMFVTGDLAFLAMILGREGMSGHWCHICMALNRGVENTNEVSVGRQIIPTMLLLID